MRKLYLFTTLILLSNILASQNKFTSITDGAVNVLNMSPNGKYITILTGETSLIWNEDDGIIAITPELETRARGVSNEGIIAGDFEDHEFMVPNYNGVMEPLFTAGIYKDDSWTNLGVNPDIENPNEESGNIAEDISFDGTIVAGGYRYSDNNTLIPAIWRNGVLEEFDIEIKGAGGKIVSINDDASVACGWYAPEGEWRPAAWINGVFKPLVYTNGMDLFGEATDVSQNGKYIVLQINNYAALYDVENDKLSIIGRHDGTISSTPWGVSNDGIVVGYSAVFGRIRRPFIYTDRLGLMDLHDYANKINLELPEGYDLGSPTKISTDGSRITGAGGFGAWVLDIENHFLGYQRPRNLKATEISLGNISLSWDAAQSDPENNFLGYNIYRDSELINVDGVITETTYQDEGVESGIHTYKVTAVWEAGESNSSESMVISVSRLVEFPFTDTFDSYSFEEYGWVTDEVTGWDVSDMSGLPAPAAQFGTFLGATYSQSLTSGFIDATNASKIYFSYNIASLAPTKDENHKLEVEIFDGEKWTKLTEYVIDVFTSYKYQEFDISSIAANKVIRVRFTAIGSGAEDVMSWVIDNVRLLDDEGRFVEEAPTGVHANRMFDNKTVFVSWFDPNGYSSLNYVSTLESNTSFGDEGNPFIVINKFSPEQLKEFDGSIITAISAFLNTDFYTEGVELELLPAYKILIYQDDKEVYSQDVEWAAHGTWNEIVLNEPYTIDASKTLSYGIEVTEYDSRDIPVALTTDKAIEGLSNLFSNDGGKTWVTISSLDSDPAYANSLALSATVVKDENVVPMERLLGYKIYRNNNIINEFYTFNCFVDTNPLTEESCYTITAYYDTDKESALPVEDCIDDITGIENEKGTDDGSFNIHPNPVTDFINIAGDFTNLKIYDLNGVVLVESVESSINLSHLPAGVYFVKIDTGNGMITKKIIKK